MQNVKIFLAGHNGLAGSAISRELSQNGYSQIITRSHSELDLTDKEATFAFFKTEKPDWVFLCAAKVGGILANSSYPVDFLLTNLKIQNNVLEACFNFQTSKLLFLGSSCIYPKFAPQPISEDALLTGLLEPTNEPYALAKITGIKLCNAFNRQYETNYLCVMPSNLYGPNDNYHSEDAHVLPMLLRRFHEAKLSHAKSVTVWGTGKPLREFLFSQDLANACVFLMQKKNASDIAPFINIGTGKEVSIFDLAHMIKKVTQFQGEIVFDPSKPDGTFRKLLDITKMRNLGWAAQTPLEDEIAKTYQDFLANRNLRT